MSDTRNKQHHYLSTVYIKGWLSQLEQTLMPIQLSENDDVYIKIDQDDARPLACY